MPPIETTSWTADDVAHIRLDAATTAPVIDPSAVKRILPGIDLWDLWPVQHRDGTVARIADGALYMVLSAPISDDPEDRHGVARIRLMHLAEEEWRDCGPLLPYGHSPGSREWAGSAILEDREVTLYFTAAGRRNELQLSFEQRIVETTGRLRCENGEIAIVEWSKPQECIVADGATYMRDMEGGGAIGTIKAFRDPAYFEDPANGRKYLLFTGSLANTCSQWNGAIGIAAGNEDGSWSLLPPLVTADDLNNELERPHVVVHQDRYYLFWSTQARVFAPAGPIGPTGLYGMVADRLGGPWRPLNGSGLVLANPPEAPFQAFSWLVTPDLTVRSFVDYPGLSEPAKCADAARQAFGGTPAPPLQLRLDGERSMLVS
ncbi:glycoside hydrolase family 68 protein [Qipengyuania qiaonensis]|uniref:Glycoside hydrolase family 68 protein n=1 Tax=Qipengyuania qiaonensis TaxID=2867240 RepID=A0ABS7JG54_9SPHN|nr:glycoside hydrolase family 68 protein [Qipengyuania qiaonensis]MBX7484017.1 glycoside hydrolase family 68 protein [Qipengyuania qiaonensis]